MTLLCLLFPRNRWLHMLLQLFLAYYYASLAIRENILRQVIYLGYLKCVERERIIRICVGQMEVISSRGGFGIITYRWV